MEIDISPTRLLRWYECCKNMEVYGEKDEHPLLDIVKCKDGTKIKIYIKKSQFRRI